VIRGIHHLHSPFGQQYPLTSVTVSLPQQLESGPIAPEQRKRIGTALFRNATLTKVSGPHHNSICPGRHGDPWTCSCPRISAFRPCNQHQRTVCHRHTSWPCTHRCLGTVQRCHSCSCSSDEQSIRVVNNLNTASNFDRHVTLVCRIALFTGKKQCSAGTGR
jgi:hypothetical protein